MIEKVAFCEGCGNKREPNEEGPCSECGETKMVVKVIPKEKIEIKESIAWVTRSEQIQKNPIMLYLSIALLVATVLSAVFIEGSYKILISVILGSYSYAVGPSTEKRVIKEERGHVN